MNRSTADLSTPPSVRRPRKIGLVQSLEEIRREKFVPFTHGPLYVHGPVPFDIVERFSAETSIEVFMTYYDFIDSAIINLPPPYGFRLFVMDDTAYPHFCKWLETVEIVDSKAQKLAVPRRVAAPILDPFMKLLGVTVPMPEIIDVWTVSRMDMQIMPTTHIEVLPYPIFKEGEAEDLTREQFLQRLPKPVTAPIKIELTKRRPDPQVIVRGKARFKEMRE